MTYSAMFEAEAVPCKGEAKNHQWAVTISLSGIVLLELVVQADDLAHRVNRRANAEALGMHTFAASFALPRLVTRSMTARTSARGRTSSSATTGAAVTEGAGSIGRWDDD